LCRSFVEMDQRKYIVYAVLLLLVIAGAYFAFKKFSQTKVVEDSSSKIIDYYGPVDSLAGFQQNGKMLFMSKCASCHNIFRDGTGPALLGVAQRGPWMDSLKLYQYIRKPESFGKSDYIDSLRKMYGSNQMAFPELSKIEIRSILEFINKQKQGITDIFVCE
jgi:cytochrome c2